MAALLAAAAVNISTSSSSASATGNGSGSSSSTSSSSDSSGSTAGSTDGIHHFNWSSKGPAKQECVETLVQALMDDPVNKYLSGGHCAKYVRHEVVGYLKALPDAANFICTPDHLAVALWQLMPEETPSNEFWAGWKRIFKVPIKLWRALLRMEIEYEAQHERIERAYGAYYYLSFIGTRSEARGKGYGSLLLKQITDRADAEGRHCTLEATSPASRRLYERHGFVCFQEYHPCVGAPPIFFMMRAPKPSSASCAAEASPKPAVRIPSDDVVADSRALVRQLSAEQQVLLRALSSRKVAALVEPSELAGAGDDAIKASREVGSPRVSGNGGSKVTSPRQSGSGGRVSANGASKVSSPRPSGAGSKVAGL